MVGHPDAHGRVLLPEQLSSGNGVAVFVTNPFAQSELDDTPIRIPKKSEILALAESMNHSEGQAIGTVEDMIYEMNSAMQDMIFRWNFCKEAYAGPVRSRDGKRQIKDLAAEGIEYLKEIRKGKLWKGDTDENK